MFQKQIQDSVRKESVGSNLSSAGDGLKKISEIEKMSSFLVENGASRFWRASLVEKLTDIRPIVEAGKNTTVTRDAQQFVASNYERLCTVYQNKKNRLETPFDFTRLHSQEYN
ncbi:DHC_N1 domain-containing protein [Caenorhabditis elegans]|uniref:DHC_N1 domain-containing protein n=1 Tax=Caenorhabditis elegans TaxID=6239 RepID=Q22761_CAEEL|nr:DHC_N1 domain-containing protein [Caenorhabditis elegans]CCD65392.1 DHC_N1 domain-containing protein [Caenorhabditis elegans]|eukprot:NP_509525.2 Uncharacterized protein CELE_T25B6.6 [Caenorhabditis elegans]